MCTIVEVVDRLRGELQSCEARMQPRQKVQRYLQRPSATAHRESACVIETSTVLSGFSLITHSTLELPTARSFFATPTQLLDAASPAYPNGRSHMPGTLSLAGAGTNTKGPYCIPCDR